MKRFRQQLCRGAMKFYQIILLLFSCQFIPTLGATVCEKISGNLTQIDAGSGSVVGVNNKSEVFVLQDSVFTKMNASLKHISVGPAGQIGVDAANKIFRFQGGRFVQFPGFLKQVDAGGDQFIAGVNRDDEVFCLNMDANNKWPSSTTPWVQMTGKLKYFSCGPYSCWGVDQTEQISVMKDVSGNVCSGSGNVLTVPGVMSMIEVASDGSVFGINREGLFKRVGVARSNPAGTTWLEIIACPKGHKHVSFDLGTLWVVCNDGSIQSCTL